MTANRDALDGLQQDVHTESSAVDAAVVLINGLANRLTDILNQSSGEDLTAEIQALRDEVAQRAVALGQAVAAGTAAENDSSNFPTGSVASSTGSTTDSSGSSQPSGSDTASSSGTSDSGNSSGSVSPTSDTSSTDANAGSTTPVDTTNAADSTTPVSPAGDGSADVAVPPPGPADNLSTGPDSPAPVETPGDTAVVPDAGQATPDESSVTAAPSE